MEKQDIYHVTLSSKGLLTLPISLRKKYNLEKGSDLKIIDEGGKLIMLPYSKASDLELQRGSKLKFTT
jgi:AbrB family looped-hinge helix DNA binding protein